MHMKSAMMPGHHIFNDCVGDFPFFLEHGKNFMSERLSNVLGHEPRCHPKIAAIMETAIRHDCVRMMIEIQEITVSVNGYARSGRSIVL